MSHFTMSFGATALLAGALTALAALPGASLAADQIETVRSASAAAPHIFEGGTALTFSVQRSAPAADSMDCEAIVSDRPPGAELDISGEGTVFRGIIIATGDGFSRLAFEDPSGRLTCLAGAGETPEDGTPVGGYQTLLNRPFGTWRFWIAASAPGPFDVHLEFE